MIWCSFLLHNTGLTQQWHNTVSKVEGKGASVPKVSCMKAYWSVEVKLHAF